MNLYWIRIDAIDDPCVDALRRLERAIASPVRRYRFREDELRHLAGLGLAALALEREVARSGSAAAGDCGPPALRRTPEGKPYFMTAGGCFEFRVSHSGEYVVCLTGKGPVGVDVERMTEPPMEIASSVFTVAERQYFCRCSAQDRSRLFFSLWCMKESILKARGRGLLDDPRGIELVGPEGIPRRETDGWRLGMSGEFPGHVLAWCGGFDEDGCVFVPVTPRDWDNTMESL